MLTKFIPLSTKNTMLEDSPLQVRKGKPWAQAVFPLLPPPTCSQLLLWHPLSLYPHSRAFSVPSGASVPQRVSPLNFSRGVGRGPFSPCFLWASLHPHPGNAHPSHPSTPPKPPGPEERRSVSSLPFKDTILFYFQVNASFSSYATCLPTTTPGPPTGILVAYHLSSTVELVINSHTFMSMWTTHPVHWPSLPSIPSSLPAQVWLSNHLALSHLSYSPCSPVTSSSPETLFS